MLHFIVVPIKKIKNLLDDLITTHDEFSVMLTSANKSLASTSSYVDVNRMESVAGKATDNVQPLPGLETKFAVPLNASARLLI